jgi:hypothetical protein
MELIKHHILPKLSSFTNEKRNSLDIIISEIENDCKTEFTGIICYLERILDLCFFSTNTGIVSLHLHIENEFDDAEKLLIGEFLIIKLFNYYHSIDSQTTEKHASLIEFISEIETNLKGLEMRCPDGASGKNGGNRIWKNWVKEKGEKRALLEFYEALDKNSSVKPKSIINAQKNFCSSLSRIFEFIPYSTTLSNKNISYNILNAINTLNEIDSVNNEIIDELDSVILFDCERKRLMNNFSLEEIGKWNNDYNTNFTRYLIITFGKESSSINHTRNKLDLIRQRFKIPTNSSFTVTRSEIDFLRNRIESSPIIINFFGFESSIFWDEFLIETSITGLYELRSIKLMNIYSICYNDEIKNYIISDLFSKRESAELISSATKLAIIELGDNDIEVLKKALSNILDLIINSDIREKVIESHSNTAAIVLDEAILRNQNLLSNIKNCLLLARSTEFRTWSDLINSKSNYFLFLSYRDQGRYPNYYSSNLLELELDYEKNAHAILPNFLFRNHYNWSRYNLLKDYHKLLDHSIRETHFEWNKLKRNISELKPEKTLVIDWESENMYANTEIREQYKVKLSGQRAKLYHSSDFIIYSNINSGLFRIERIKWFFENIDYEESKYGMQKLDELLDEFNPAEKLIDTSQQEIELQIIRDQLGLENVTAGAIWKVLLNKKAESIGLDTLYSDLLQLFSNNNIPLVKQNYFINFWLNTRSDTLMPRGNKIVKVLFDYLQLSGNYRLILYRLKNTSIAGKIEATKKYSNLLKDLFYDGCFDSNSNLISVLHNKLLHYRQNHSLEELGIDSENPISGLIALVELIKPEIKTFQLDTIEKNNNE